MAKTIDNVNNPDLVTLIDLCDLLGYTVSIGGHLRTLSESNLKHIIKAYEGTQDEQKKKAAEEAKQELQRREELFMKVLKGE